MSKTEHPELYRKHRPTSFKKMVGQDGAISILTTKVKAKQIPHAILITGPSGVGKTTIARILQKPLDCVDSDFYEINCAGNGIDRIREIRDRMMLKGLTGGKRIYLLDEIHKLSIDGQNALLKMLEDPPDHIYFILCTTDPGKVIRTIQTRCLHIKLKSIGVKELAEIVQSIADIEGVEIREEVLDRLVEVAEGSARQALVLLDSIRGLEGEDAQLAAISNPENKQAAFDIVKALLWEKATWSKVAKILKGIPQDDPEGIRYLVLANATAEMLKCSKNSPRAYMIVTAFRDNFYDSKFAGLVAACWESINPV